MEPRDRWDKVAHRYDSAISLLENRFMAPGRRRTVPHAHGRVLEIGIGTGANLPLYPAGVELVGVDISPGMLKEASVKPLGSLSGITLREASAVDLPFLDHEFDSVVASYVMCCVPDLDLALREAVRVLKPGGSLLLADHVRSSNPLLRLGQRALEFFTIRSADEYFTRRPLDHLQRLDVVATGRHRFGIMEWVRARKPVETDDLDGPAA